MMIFKREPALWLGLLQAVIALAVVFGLELSPGQIGAVMGVAAGIGALVVRQSVTPTATDPNDMSIGTG